MKAAILALLVLTGCHTVPPAPPVWKPDASLLTLCDPEGPMLEAGDGGSITAWGAQMRKEYKICAARHKRLAESAPK